jgi:diketogulonate reductase-like aldo/keto reductase
MGLGDGTDASQTVTLSDGAVIPLLGFGVWQVPDGRTCTESVRWAIEAGYRHLDTAQAYENEGSVGQAIAQSGLPRETLFITTKFFPESTDPAVEMEHSLRRLGVEYVDLYLVHWPAGGPTWAWPGMEKAHERGHTRSIGVSNFSTTELAEVMAVSTTPPVVNQIQLNPFADRRRLIEEGRRLGLTPEAYSPLGTGEHLSDPTVGAVADAVGRSPAQVLLRWCLERELVVLPKSTHRERIIENAQIFDFELPADQLAVLDGLDETGGTEVAREDRWW